MQCYSGFSSVQFLCQWRHQGNADFCAICDGAACIICFLLKIFYLIGPSRKFQAHQFVTFCICHWNELAVNDMHLLKCMAFRQNCVVLVGKHLCVVASTIMCAHFHAAPISITIFPHAGAEGRTKSMRIMRGHNVLVTRANIISELIWTNNHFH